MALKIVIVFVNSFWQHWQKQGSDRACQQELTHPCQQSLTLWFLCLIAWWGCSSLLDIRGAVGALACHQPPSPSLQHLSLLPAASVILENNSWERRASGGAAGWGTEIELRTRGWNRPNSRREPCSVFLLLEMVFLPPTLAAFPAEKRGAPSCMIEPAEQSAHRCLTT